MSFTKKQRALARLFLSPWQHQASARHQKVWSKQCLLRAETQISMFPSKQLSDAKSVLLMEGFQWFFLKCQAINKCPNCVFQVFKNSNPLKVYYYFLLFCFHPVFLDLEVEGTPLCAKWFININQRKYMVEESAVNDCVEKVFMGKLNYFIILLL